MGDSTRFGAYTSMKYEFYEIRKITKIRKLFKQTRFRLHTEGGPYVVASHLHEINGSCLFGWESPQIQHTIIEKNRFFFKSNVDAQFLHHRHPPLVRKFWWRVYESAYEEQLFSKSNLYAVLTSYVYYIRTTNDLLTRFSFNAEIHGLYYAFESPFTWEGSDVVGRGIICWICLKIL